MSKNFPVNEGDVKDGIKDVFKELDAWFYMPVQTGMGVGGIHDFIACVPVTVTQEMVGKRIGLFVSVETKAPELVADLLRLAKAGRKSAHLAKDGQFVSNNSLQTYHADAIHDAGGIAKVSDDAKVLRDELSRTLTRLRCEPHFPEGAGGGLTTCDMDEDESI